MNEIEKSIREKQRTIARIHREIELWYESKDEIAKIGEMATSIIGVNPWYVSLLGISDWENGETAVSRIFVGYHYRVVSASPKTLTEVFEHIDLVIPVDTESDWESVMNDDGLGIGYKRLLSNRRGVINIDWTKSDGSTCQILVKGFEEKKKLEYVMVKTPIYEVFCPE